MDRLLRAAADASAEALGTMQQTFAGTDQQAVRSVGRAREAAQQISPTEALLDQKEALRTFFREAGNALQNMATTGSEALQGTGGRLPGPAAFLSIRLEANAKISGG